MTAPVRRIRIPLLVAMMVAIVLVGPITVVLWRTYGASAETSASALPVATTPASPSSPAPETTTQSSAAPAKSNSATGKTPGTFVGEWRVHGSSLTIKADLTGTAVWNAGLCSMTSNLMCSGHADLRFTADGEQLRGKYTAVRYLDQNDRKVPSFDPGADAVQVGDTITLVAVNTDVLKQTDVSGGANPYLCGPRASQQWRTECNV